VSASPIVYVYTSEQTGSLLARGNEMEFQGFGGFDECAKCRKDDHVYEWVTTSGAVRFYCIKCQPLEGVA
jgi:hypothetical protein